MLVFLYCYSLFDEMPLLAASSFTTSLFLWASPIHLARTVVLLQLHWAQGQITDYIYEEKAHENQALLRKKVRLLH